jgi:two-component system nitrogen regulation response regulator GlnG
VAVPDTNVAPMQGPEGCRMNKVSTANCSVALAPQGPLSVLLVDDDEAFRRGLADNLREDGHAVFDYAAPGEVPVSTFGAVSVVVTDFDLPGNDGLSFADHVHAEQPNLPVVVVTAHPGALAIINVVARSFLRFVQKPVDYQCLHRLLHVLVAAAASTQPLS